MHSMLKHAKNTLKSCFEACFEYCLRKVDYIQWILKLILSLLVAPGIYMNGHHHIQFLFHQSFISAGNIVGFLQTQFTGQTNMKGQFGMIAVTMQSEMMRLQSQIDRKSVV